MKGGKQQLLAYSKVDEIGRKGGSKDGGEDIKSTVRPSVVKIHTKVEKNRANRSINVRLVSCLDTETVNKTEKTKRDLATRLDKVLICSLLTC